MKRASRNGFTFLQLAILLTVAALVMVAVLPGLQSNLMGGNTTTTKMEAILSAMRGYLAANGTLPCPADASLFTGNANYGAAVSGSGAMNNCNGLTTPAGGFIDSTNHVAVGMVPFRTLGLSKDYATDSWGRDITYAVDTSATACWPSSSLPGQIAVYDNGPINHSVAALVSHGPDGHGAWVPFVSSGSSGSVSRHNAGSTDTDQLVNAHLTSGTFPTPASSSLLSLAEGGVATFVHKSPTATFDDLVVYRNPQWTLNNLPSDATYPTLTTYPSSGTYSAGQTLTFVLTFPGAVTVNTASGTPYLALSALGGGSNTIGTGNVAKAVYVSGSGITALTFQYTIGAGDVAASGISVSAPVILNGGALSVAGSCFRAQPFRVIISNSTNTLCAYFPSSSSPPSGSGVVMGLSTSVTLSGCAAYEAYAGSSAFLINSPAMLTASAIFGAGQVDSGGCPGCTSPAVSSSLPTVTNPYSSITPPAYGSCTTTSNGGTINPGCYAGITLGSNLTMNPGTYTVENYFNTNGYSITGSGVTIFFSSGMSFLANSPGVLTLSAPTSGPYAGLLFYGPGSGSIQLNGSTNWTFQGILYMPGWNFLSGGASAPNTCTQMVGGDLSVSGGPISWTTSNCPSGYPLITYSSR